MSDKERKKESEECLVNLDLTVSDSDTFGSNAIYIYIYDKETV